MENSIKRNYSNNPLITIYRVFMQKPRPYSSGIIRPEISAKESLDYFEANEYFNQLADETENIDIHFEKILVDQNNEIVDTYTIASKTYPC